jgi:hypothetical protein
VRVLVSSVREELTDWGFFPFVEAKPGNNRCVQVGGGVGLS